MRGFRLLVLFVVFVATSLLASADPDVAQNTATVPATVATPVQAASNGNNAATINNVTALQQKAQATEQRLRDQNTNLASRIGELQADVNQSLNQIQQLKQTIDTLQSQNQQLRQSNASLLDQLQRLQGVLQNDKRAKAVLASEEPSFSSVLLKQTHSNLRCVKGDCQFSQLPMTDQDKINTDQIDQAMSNRYVMPVSIIALIILIVVLLILICITYYNIARTRKQMQQEAESISRHEDLEAIAGENLADSKLDMAKALMEMGEKRAAKDALQEVIEHGNKAQKEQARHLLDNLND